MCLESLAGAGQNRCTDNSNDNENNNGTFSHEMIRPGYPHHYIGDDGLSKSVNGRFCCKSRLLPVGGRIGSSRHRP